MRKDELKTWQVLSWREPIRLLRNGLVVDQSCFRENLSGLDRCGPWDGCDN